MIVDEGLELLTEDEAKGLLAVGGVGRIGIIPVPVVIMVIVYALAWVLLQRTPCGRHVYAIGGTETAARTARRSPTEPPNQCGSHRTEIAAAPPAAYARARATASSAGTIAPAEGDDRLTSAMRCRPGAR